MSQPKLIMLAAAISVGMCPTLHADPYAEVTSGRHQVIDKSYFGTHFHYLVIKPGDNKHLTKWPTHLIGSIRLWDSRTRWADITPSAGQWNFDCMDAYVDRATVNHASILYTLGSTPRWASARPEEKCPYGFGCSSEPVRLAHWEEYVRQVAQRYRGKITAYELWNEPYFSDIARDREYLGFYSGSVDQMVEMARIARKVLDEFDPGAILSTPGFVNGPERLEMFLAAGGKQYVQAIAYHFYAENSLHMASQLAAVRQIMKRQGVEKLPLWNTETGIDVLGPNGQPSGIAAHSQTEAAEKLAQYMILGAAADLQHYYQYAWDNQYSGMLTPYGEHQTTWDAYEKVESWLLGSTMRGCASAPRDVVICQSERSGQHFHIVWAQKEAMVKIPVPSDQRVVSVEKLFDAAPMPIAVSNRFLNITLGLEPVRVLLETK